MKDLFVTKFESKTNCGGYFIFGVNTHYKITKKKSSIVVAILSYVFHSIWSAS
ncbi:hypothetical protein JHK86_036034 [Glycine max]|nr:hypothetical protein JHK86_036034 [Glycine max]